MKDDFFQVLRDMVYCTVDCSCSDQVDWLLILASVG